MADEKTINYDVSSIQALEGIEPVSYTHLRAHETVLDLVCRLLLEKKNKHQRHSSCTVMNNSHRI